MLFRSRMVLSQNDIMRWNLAGDYTKKNEPHTLDYETSHIQLNTSLSIYSSLGSFSSRYLPGYEAPLAFAICTAAYGTPHIIGWDAHFPTHTQRLLWHVSSVILPACGCLYFIPRSLLWFYGKYITRVKFLVSGRGIVLGFIPLVFLVYILASGFLVVTSIQQLTILPPEVFRQPSIANLWPHIS